MKIAAMSSSTPIAARLNQELATQQEFNKDTLLNLLSCINFLNDRIYLFVGTMKIFFIQG